MGPSVGWRMDVERRRCDVAYVIRFCSANWPFHRHHVTFFIVALWMIFTDAPSFKTYCAMVCVIYPLIAFQTIVVNILIANAHSASTNAHSASTIRSVRRVGTAIVLLV